MGVRVLVRLLPRRLELFVSVVPAMAVAVGLLLLVPSRLVRMPALCERAASKPARNHGHG